ncbi:hypothetical protein MANES_08G076048v8 [Manihot esculenta]|uniref:Uncharacterized protein n=1 Tax=Manihot esculenta TaxID=3983 RepID=A0ACB7H949_MANES|nr:hypothetical protein MANES_08G076048v8 [Manihot esculenta]
MPDLSIHVMLLLRLIWSLKFMIFGSKMKHIGGKDLGCNGYRKEIEIPNFLIYRLYNNVNKIVLIAFNLLRVVQLSGTLSLLFLFRTSFKIFISPSLYTVVIKFSP